MKQKLSGRLEGSALQVESTEATQGIREGSRGLLTYFKGSWFFLAYLAHQGIQKPGSSQPPRVVAGVGSLALSRAFWGPGQASAMRGRYRSCW